MRAWLDVPPADALEAAISSNQSNLSKNRRAFRSSTYSMPPMLAEVVERVRCYHRIPKANLQQIGARVSALANISRYSLQQAKGSTGPVTGGLGQEGLTTDVYMRLLAARAHTKAIYLRRLERYYQQGGTTELLNPQSLIATLTGVQQKREEASLLGLSPNVLLEKIDPAHRAWEFVKDDPTKGSSSGAKLLDAWFKAVTAGDCDQPFLIYLEAADHSLDESTGAQIHAVDYQSAQTGQGTIYCLSGEEGTMSMGRMKPGCDDVDWVPFDTTKDGTNAQHFSAKGAETSKPSMAYNWTRTKELYMDYHNPGARGERELGLAPEFHHSSITSGEFVRCAGMIAGENGKVTYIDNNSGHYRPSREYLLKLVSHLRQHGLFSQDATVRDTGDKSQGKAGVPVNDFS